MLREGFIPTQKQPKTILHEWCQKHKVPIPRYTAREAPDNKQGFICKIVLPDRHKPDSDVVLWMNDISSNKVGYTVVNSQTEEKYCLFDSSWETGPDDIVYPIWCYFALGGVFAIKVPYLRQYSFGVFCPK